MSPGLPRSLTTLLLGYLLLGLLPRALAEPEAPPVRIVFDTDMETDCDDAGALGVLHALADRHECEILATVVSVRDLHSVATVDAINTYYHRPRLPLGMVKGPGVLEKSKYAGLIAKGFPNRVRSEDDIPDAAVVYRDALERAPDHSVTIVTVGFLTNLRNLLNLSAVEDHPSGRDLIRAKVAKWVCMGGNFIGNPARDDLKLGNVNFQRDAAAALEVIQHWPTPVVFVGREIGSVPSGLQVGDCLAKTPENNPVRMAYYYYLGGQKNRHAADLVTVLYAVRGLRDYWDIHAGGFMDIRPDMTFEWKPEPDRHQSYLLKKRRDGKPNDRYIESVLEELLTQPPGVQAGE
ncbi:MAG TPA: nucleoside hydrolase [Chthoniobacter sp.]